MIGPNAAPNPAQAKETNFKMVFVLPQAKNNATIDTASTAILPKNTYCLSDAFVLNTALYKSSINADDVTINCDDIVLITAAKTAANIIPDRKSTRLKSSHVAISYAVFCLKKKT